jgi:hypothetical protein
VTLRELVRHAQRFGTDGVYEAAAVELPASERPALREALARIDAGSSTDVTLSGATGLCAECAAPFPARRSTARYCSTRCRVRAHRRRS